MSFYLWRGSEMRNLQQDPRHPLVSCHSLLLSTATREDWKFLFYYIKSSAFLKITGFPAKNVWMRTHIHLSAREDVYTHLSFATLEFGFIKSFNPRNIFSELLERFIRDLMTHNIITWYIIHFSLLKKKLGCFGVLDYKQMTNIWKDNCSLTKYLTGDIQA